jgi:hypothetical protein
VTKRITEQTALPVGWIDKMLAINKHIIKGIANPVKI